MLHRSYLTRIALTALLACATPALAAAAPFATGADSFANSIPLEDSELDSMRGGFLDIGGAKIDFGLVNRTIIDGITRNEFSLSTANIDQISELNQTFIQNGDTDDLASLSQLIDIPGLLTIVENSQDNTLIQNLNELDITVANFGDIRSNSALGNALRTNPTDGLR